MTDQPENLLRVSATSSPQSLGAAIAHAIYEDHHVKMRAIGAGAVNQATKSIAIARGMAAPRGHDLVCVPSFESVPAREGDGEISAISFYVFDSRTK